MSFFNFFKRNHYQEMVRASYAWWNTIYKPDDFYDSIDLPLKVHLCGNEAMIEKKASELYGKTVEYSGRPGLAMPTKINGRWHIFILATEIGYVKREGNPFIAGHELLHIIDLENESNPNGRVVDYLNPDDGRE